MIAEIRDIAARLRDITERGVAADEPITFGPTMRGAIRRQIKRLEALVADEGMSRANWPWHPADATLLATTLNTLPAMVAERHAQNTKATN